MRRRPRLLKLLALLALPACSAAPLSVVSSLTSIWEKVAMEAAEATLKAIQQQTGSSDWSLRDVPMDSVQVFVGRTHHLAVEVEGQAFELVLNSQPLDSAGGSGAPSGPTRQALPMPEHMSSTALAQFKADPARWQARQHIALPEVTLAGPVELVFSRVTDLSLFLPHSTDVPRARRLLVAPGAALTLRQLRSISLRKPLDLPKLPGSFLAEVYATMKLGEAEPGFENAPGMLHLAGELWRAATNASLGLGDASGRTKQLLSFEIEPAGSSVTVLAARQPGEAVAPRLKLRKHADGTLELSLRDADAASAAVAAARAAAAPGGAALSSLAAQPWAWPLPLVDMKEWVRYETLLRSILAAQPLHSLSAQLQRGVGLRLTRSSVKGVSMIAFDMELATSSPALSGAQLPADSLLDLDGIEGGDQGLEVWEAVVEVRQRDEDGRIEFVPITVRRKHAYTSTLTLSPHALQLALGGGSNATGPVLGAESRDLGLARHAAEAGGDAAEEW